MTIIAENANNPEQQPIQFVKICSACYETKPSTDFYKSAINKDGLCGQCKVCHNKQVIQNRKNKKLLSFKQVAPHKKFWLIENKLKRKAHGEVGYAIQIGKLVRQPCERCGTTEHVVAHHEDYSKPLDVVWLCKYHHKERHLEIDKENKNKPKPDMINHPPHYTQGGIETIEYIRAKLSPEEYVGYLRGNIFKYTSRIGLKGESSEDSGKIEWYSKELNKFLTER
jgi:Protein of unknwon function (DUF3310)